LNAPPWIRRKVEQTLTVKLTINLRIGNQSPVAATGNLFILRRITSMFLISPTSGQRASTKNMHTELLACAGRLLLEFNESTGSIHRALTETARKITDEKLELAVTYGGVVVSIGNGTPQLEPVQELRYNAALQARVRSILDAVGNGTLEPAAALAALERAEADTPRHPRWLAATLLGLAAACLALILGADFGAAVVAGVSTALGLVARQELHKHHFSLLTLPLAAAFIGAVLGGLAIRFGWTRTPGLVLIVPSLMLIPGPHLLNGMFDMIDNYVPMSLARLGLAIAIIFASALGIVLGIELTLSGPPIAEQTAKSDYLNLISDMLLAGVVTCGFAIFYNAAWAQIAMAAVGGMVGHGLRYVALEAGARVEVATFLGGLAVGVVSAFIARSYKIPFAVIAFAGAVTMMPGLQMYRALGGLLQLAQDKSEAELSKIAGTLGDLSQATVVVGALALGLIIAARSVQLFTAKNT
jgi:uncharacterized membrane protein YjjP (DUF1212 family)